MIERNIKKLALEYASEFPVLAFVGARQSGKTTLIRDLFKNYKYYNLESINDYNIIKEDPVSAINVENPYIIIDEIQRAPELLSQIQAVVDEQKIMGSIIISGSQNILMSQSISQTLAGRAAYIEVPQLTLSEIDTVEKHELLDLIHKGQYPTLYDRKINPSRFYNQYLQTYVERDVRLLKNITNLDAFKKFTVLLAGRIGQIFNANSIANDVGISSKTAKDWLSVLKASYLVYELNPYYVNIGKQLVKSSKIYFYDTGLLCFLLNIATTNELSAHYLIGNIFENFVISDILKEYTNIQSLQQFYFFRDKVGNEVDIMVKNGKHFEPFEIKYGNTFSRDFVKGIKHWNNLQINNVEKSTKLNVIYRGEQQSDNSNINLINWRNATQTVLDL